MARKKRSGAAMSSSPVPMSSPGAPPAPARAAQGVPPGAGVGGGVVAILSLMMFLAPALGSPREELLQDTLKSIIVSFGALAAALWLLWQWRGRAVQAQWHGLVALPLLLMAHALGSMAWSHTYLGGVEAVRWFIFALLLWVGAQVLTRERVITLAWGIHAGAVVASVWAALQFWMDFRFFPQGPNPASTFVNRNFFAEYVVCALPFSVLLLARARSSATMFFLALTIGLNIVALMMTGTRSALVSLLMLAVLLPVVLWLYRAQFEFPKWRNGHRWMVGAVLALTVLGLGYVDSGNPRVLDEGRGNTPMARAWSRTLSLATAEEYAVRSFSIRLIMWKDTARMMAANPLSGVGAGAWEVEAPLYQSPGSQLETDYYAHNEILQLLAEYGLIGWLFLLLLLAYLVSAAWRTWRDRSAEGLAEAPLRALALASLLAMLLVSNAGFPWRLAATGAIFALALAVLAASDLRRAGPRWLEAAVPVRPVQVTGGLAGLAVCTALAGFITHQAVQCEYMIVRATRLALTVSGSGAPGAPRWAKTRAEIIELIRTGTRINPHYRKITPIVADELARWGDWRNAIWIWESVISSRPHIVVILTNIARGHVYLGQYEQAAAYLERARALQPNAPAVRSLDVVLMSRTGQEARAAAFVRDAMDNNSFDQDMLNAAFILGQRTGDHALAIRAMTLRIERWPETAAAGWMHLGNFYHSVVRDDVKAVEALRAGLQAARGPREREDLLTQVPPVLLPGVNAAVAPAPQTSASKP